MNSKFIKAIGVTLIVLTFIVIPILIISPFITERSDLSRLTYSLAFAILYSIIVFILGFFPGRFLYMVGKEKKKLNNLIAFSLWIIIISAIITLLSLLLILFAFIYPAARDAMIILEAVFPAVGILYCVGIFLLIINWFINRNK